MKTIRTSSCGTCFFGILIMWNDEDHPHIERCDDCKFYKTDAAAAMACNDILFIHQKETQFEKVKSMESRRIEARQSAMGGPQSQEDGEPQGSAHEAKGAIQDA